MRLSNKSLSNSNARTPDYDRENVTTGIIHLGIGAFHRAHQAVYIDDLLAGDLSWGIVGASLRSSKTADALNSQDGLYTVVTFDDTTPAFRVIGSISHVINATSHRQSLIDQMADKNVRIVSLTVTEKGYCHIPATGLLDLNNDDIQYDIANPIEPRTAPGFIVAALRQRHLEGTQPFTVLSCDNLPNNGTVAKNVVVALARVHDTALANWIEKNVTFPATMVDRIVPATSPEMTSLVKSETGVDDAWPVTTEPFCQWIIEDNFCAGRPAFESVGAILTDNVIFFEKMKLRLLNGSHSALAYMGLLKGYTTVAQAIQDPAIKAFIQTMMEKEIADTLSIPAGVDLPAYQTALLARFANPSLNHSLLQIASDGTQKLPQRILDPIRDRMKNNQAFPMLAQVIASWLRFVSSHNGDAYRFPLNDPLAIELRRCIEQSKPPQSGLFLDLLHRNDIFGDDLSANSLFHEAVEKGGEQLNTTDVL